MDASQFLQAHLAAHPEEASTLGLCTPAGGHAARLPDPSPEAAGAEAARARAALSAIGDPGADLDLDAAVRVARFTARYVERDRDASNLELAALPNAMLQHAALHAKRADDWEALAARAAAVPDFLRVHAENLRRGIAEDEPPDPDVARAFVDRVLPGAAEAVGTLAFTARTRRLDPALVARVADAASAARDAYRAFARIVADDVVPAARREVVLGEEEIALRLRDVMGVEATIDDLLREARDALAKARAAFDGARVASLVSARPASFEETLAGYRHYVLEATGFVRDREIVRVPPALALELEPLPGGIADGASVTNWPAPLFAPNGKGHVLLATDPTAHARIAMKNLAVHEAVPGHYLQSVAWQRGAKMEHACRYLGVADDVAFARGYFGAMISVEGWAVHMEQRLRAHGFYDADERVFFDFCDALRAARVIVDLELHRGRMDGEAAARFVADATGMPESWARAQVLRSKRIPLQGLTYHVGERAIAELRRGFSGDDLAFHDALLALGPVPATRAARALGVT